MIYRSDEVDPQCGNGIFLRGGGCISTAFVQFFWLLVQSTISTYGTKYNKSCTHAYAHRHARTRAGAGAHTRARTHEIELVIVQSTISISYCIKYNKVSVIVTLSNLFSYCKKYNK